jgi:hypothetical protein
MKLRTGRNRGFRGMEATARGTLRPKFYSKSACRIGQTDAEFSGSPPVRTAAEDILCALNEMLYDICA